MILCIEGVNGSGKSTVAEALVRSLEALSRPAKRIDPANLTSFGKTVRRAILDTPADQLSADAEALAFTAARMQAAPSLKYEEKFTTVVLERWAGAPVAFGKATGVDDALLDKLSALMTKALAPDKVLLLDVPGKVAADRLANAPNKNRFETAGASSLEKIRQGYLAWARANNVPVVDGTAERELVARAVQSLLL